MAAYADFHRRSIADREGFWREEAQLIDWKRPFEVTRYVIRADRAGFTYELQIDD